jgi:hypothetical protein
MVVHLFLFSKEQSGESVQLTAVSAEEYTARALAMASVLPLAASTDSCLPIYVAFNGLEFGVTTTSFNSVPLASSKSNTRRQQVRA